MLELPGAGDGARLPEPAVDAETREPQKALHRYLFRRLFSRGASGAATAFAVRMAKASPAANATTALDDAPLKHERTM